MKKTFLILSAVALVLGGCGKNPSTGLNDTHKKVFESWMHVHYPDAVQTSLGSYVIDDIPGTGENVGTAEETPYLRIEFYTTDLDFTIVDYSSEKVAKQLGEYSEANTYCPDIIYRGNNGINAGLEEAINSMRVGGKKSIVVPGWLNTFSRYGTRQEYLDNVSGSDLIYNIEVLEKIPDIRKWEVDSLCRYMAREFPQVSPADSLKYGFYYVRTKEPSDTSAFKNDTTFYINYTGRLLNGKVFDTTIKDTAIFYGIYKSGSSYEPVLINMAEKVEDITMTSSGSSVIEGFAYQVSIMHNGEAGSGIFYSGFGYGSNGSEPKIPSFSPLRFDIEVVKKN